MEDNLYCHQTFTRSLRWFDANSGSIAGFFVFVEMAKLKKFTTVLSDFGEVLIRSMRRTAFRRFAGWLLMSGHYNGRSSHRYRYVCFCVWLPCHRRY